MDVCRCADLRCFHFICVCIENFVIFAPREVFELSFSLMGIKPKIIKILQGVVRIVREGYYTRCYQSTDSFFRIIKSVKNDFNH